MDWAGLVMGDWMARLDRMALRRFGQQVIADEAVNHVLERLSADNWAALTGYRGKSQPVSYLNAVAANFLEEFARRKYGRPRPPVWLKRNGHLWVSIWRQVCLERQLTGQVIFNRSSADCSRAYLEDIIRVIKARMPWCGVKHQEIPADYLDTGAASGTAAAADDGDDIDNNSLEEQLLVVRLLLDPDAVSDAVAASAAIQARVASLRDAAALSDHELLILRLIFIERIKQGVVATNLGLKPYQLSRQLKALLARLRAGLEASGFSREEFFA